MSAVVAVLLVPAEGDPHGLLRNGRCGARPPTAWRFNTDKFWSAGKPHGRPGKPHGRRDRRNEMIALVLAWDGQPVAEGIDRAQRISCPDGWRKSIGFGDTLPKPLGRAYFEARYAQWAGYGTIVLLDAEGREVA